MIKFPLMRNNILREDLDRVIQYLQQDDPILTHGANVSAFENEWSKWLGVKYSVFVNSGASANLIAMTILKLSNPEGGEVIVPPLTWVSDIASVLQTGFRPVFADIDPCSLSMGTDEIIEKLSPSTTAVFMTHAQGFDGLTDRLLEELVRRDVRLIEDVCESHGATHNGRRLGSFGWISNFSFYYAHHMSTIEGGMICTDDEEVYETARMLRSHGLVREAKNSSLRGSYIQGNPELNPDFIFAYAGYNMRNTEIGGILGRNQLTRLNENVARRNQNLYRFLNGLDPNKYRTKFTLAGCSNYAFNLILKEPDVFLLASLKEKMREAGIEFRQGSAGGGNQIRQPYLRDFVPADHHLEFPNVEHVHFFGFYLGNFPDLSNREIDELLQIVNSA